MKILYVTTISLTMNSFFKPHIEMLVREGNQVDIACNYKDLPLDHLYGELGCMAYQVDFSRSPLSSDNLKAFRQLRKVVENGQYDIVHCHTPNASVITRLVCQAFRKKNGLKVFYTAHGFHFFKGAPKVNWLVYYPVEKLCSYFTDKLVTINREDYALAQKKFEAKEVYYIPGVGIDLSRFANIQVDRKVKRREIGIPEDATLLLSVGELNENKNHQILIRAMAALRNSKLHYMIAGTGDQYDVLQCLADDMGLHENVHLLGYRKDVHELYEISDIFCHPSHREGLPVSLMEAMAHGKPAVCSRIRGNTDLIDDKGGKLFDSSSLECCVDALKELLQSHYIEMGKHNAEVIKDFGIDAIKDCLRKLYA